MASALDMSLEGKHDCEETRAEHSYVHLCKPRRLSRMQTPVVRHKLHTLRAQGARGLLLVAAAEAISVV